MAANQQGGQMNKPLPARTPVPSGAQAAPKRPSDTQIGYALRLLDERELLNTVFRRANGQHVMVTEDYLRDDCSSREVSGLIDKLKHMAYRPTRRNAYMPDVPDGRYAVQAPGDSMLGFYKITTTDRGFRKLYRQLSDDYVYISPQDPHNEGVWQTIAVNVREAALRYGRELGICSVCTRTLTNKDSRRFGMGPICRARREW